MTFINENLTTQLKQCLALAQSVETQREAQQKFEQLQQQMSHENPEGVALME